VRTKIYSAFVFAMKMSLKSHTIFKMFYVSMKCLPQRIKSRLIFSNQAFYGLKTLFFTAQISMQQRRDNSSFLSCQKSISSQNCFNLLSTQVWKFKFRSWIASCH